MKPKYWLVLGVVAVGTTQLVACSSQSDSCEETRTCASKAGAGPSDAGAGPSDAGAGPSEGGAAPGGGASGGGAGKHAQGDAGEGGLGGEAGALNGEGGSAGSVPSTPALFGACNTAGKTVCQGVASAERLSCDGVKWQPGSVCPVGELCDSSTGDCAKIVPECATVKPGDSVCRGDIALKCGPDLVTTDTGKACDGLCVNGACQAPTCGDQKVEAGETCDDHNSVAGDGCSPTCHSEAVSISVGGSTSCAISATGQLKCWGDNAFGQLGQGNTDAIGDSPQELAAMKPIDLGTGRTAKSVVVGTNDVCALLDNKIVKCWGDNSVGQLGQGDLRARGAKPNEMGDKLPPVILGEDAVAVSIGGSHACAILADGGVKCWGDGGYGQLGYDNSQAALSPALLPKVYLGAGRTARAVSCGYDHTTCAVLDDSTAKCWGYAGFGMLSLPAALPGSEDGGFGNAPNEMETLPALNFNGQLLKSAAITVHSACAVLADNTVRCWGANSWGQVGTDATGYFGTAPDTLAALPAIPLGSGNTVQSLSLGAFHACAVLTDGSVKCWGANNSGSLGLGLADGQGQGDQPGEMEGLKPVPLGAGRTARQVSIGDAHACALLDDGTIKCWGKNDLGQLGVGDILTRGNTAGFELKAVELGF